MTKRQAFYTGRTWARFVARLKIERAQPDGTLLCEHCGKPIVRAYDCIGHHSPVELTEENVDDAAIALNPENVMLVHFRCHNLLHERFNGRTSVIKQVFLVYGAPCAGKSTWVSEQAERDDLILDIDRLWGAVRSDCCGQHEKPDALRSVIFDLRDCIIGDIRTRRGKWRRAFVIGGYPFEGERNRIADLIGADRQILIDTPLDVCLHRAEDKAPEWKEYVREWFDRYGEPPS